MNQIERKAVFVLCGLSPWLLGLAPAYIAWSSLVALAWPIWLCWVMAGAVEMFGTMATSEALSLRDYNATRRQTLDPKAPEGAAWAIVGVYILASTTFCAIHAWPSIAAYSLVLWPVMGASAMVSRALRQDHARRLAKIEQDNAQRKADRLQHKAEVAAMVAPPAATVDRRAAMLAILRNDGHATPVDIAQQLGISRQAVAKRLQTLERQGAIADGNGEGWRVMG